MPNTSYSYYLHCNSLHSRIAAYAHDNILPLLHCLRGDAFVSSSACHNSVRQWPKISIFASAGKTMRWIEKWLTPFRIVTTFSISVQSLGEIELRAPAVGAKLNWCFCMSRFVCLRVGDIVQTSIVWRFMGRFWCALRCFFPNGSLFQMHYIVLIFVAGWRHNFREIAVKNCEKSKNQQKSLCAPLRIDSWEIWRKFHCSSLGQRT